MLMRERTNRLESVLVCVGVDRGGGGLRVVGCVRPPVVGCDAC